MICDNDPSSSRAENTDTVLRQGFLPPPNVHFASICQDLASLIALLCRSVEDPDKRLDTELCQGILDQCLMLSLGSAGRETISFKILKVMPDNKELICEIPRQ